MLIYLDQEKSFPLNAIQQCKIKDGGGSNSMLRMPPVAQRLDWKTPNWVFVQERVRDVSYTANTSKC